jgi:uncharacterized protein (TIGR02099 family)
MRIALAAHRWFWWLASGVLIALLSLHLALRIWVVPQIPERRQEIESALAEAIKRPVRLGEIHAGWSGLQPRVDIDSLTVMDEEGRPALVVPAINASLSWRSLAARTVVFGRLHVAGLELFLRRTADGTILLADIPLNRGDDNRFLDWLQQQRGIDLERSVLHWDDDQRAAPRLTLRDVDLRIRNRGERHQFGLLATPPDTLAAPLDMRGDWRGQSVAEPASGRGRLYASLQRVDLEGLLPWIDLPFGVSRGKGSLQLWLDVDGAAVTSFTADAGLTGLRARLDGADNGLNVRSLSGRVALINRKDHHALELRNLTLQTGDGVVAPDTTLSWRQDGEGDAARHRVRIQHLVLRPLFQTAASLPIPDDLRRLILQAVPRGELHDVSAEWQGKWLEPARYTVKGRFDDLGLSPFEGFPGFDSSSGSVDANETGGRVALRFGTAPLLWPGHLRRAVPVHNAEAEVSWRRVSDDWRIEVSDARIDTGELRASLRGTWSPGARSMVLDAKIEHLDADAARHYLPGSVGEGTREWLQIAFPAGGRGSGDIQLRGDPERFPFNDGKGGHFEANLDLRVPALVFSPEWPRLKAVDGRLRFVNAAVAVEGARARVGRDALEQIHLRIPDLDADDPFLEISGQLNTSLGEALDYIQNSPVRAKIDGTTDGMSGQGKVALKMSLHVPLDHSADTTVKGDALLDVSRLETGPDRPPLTALSGHLLFTEQGISSPGLTANLLGGPARASLKTLPGGAVRIDASGRARIASLAQQFPLRAWGLARGEAQWHGELVFAASGTRISVQSGLEGVTLDLPQPLFKAPAETQALRFVWQGGERGDRYELDIGTRIHARVTTREQAGGRVSSIAAAMVGLGSAPLPGERASGIDLAAELPQFFATQWLPVFDRFTEASEGDQPLPVKARIKAARFELEGQFLGETDLSVDRPGEVWNWVIRGADAEGSGQWDARGRGAITARLARLALGAPVDGASVPQDEDRTYPALDVEIGSLSRGGREYGQLHLKASQQGRNWQIDQLRLTAPEYELDANGEWQSWRSKPVTDFKVELKTTDTGRYLERLGYGSVIKAAPATLKGALRWRGPPTDLDLASLSGQFRLETGKGQFLKANPGAARLLGIVSLQALPRRITLDFRDIFSEGLAFDDIEGDLAVTDGIMHTDKFFIDGPAAKVYIKGQVDLAKETQDLQVKVSPAMDAATIGALIANPVAGLAVFLAQQLLNDPLGKLVTFNYRITGAWSEPVVARQGAPELGNRGRSGKTGGDKGTGGEGPTSVLPSGAP